MGYYDYVSPRFMTILSRARPIWYRLGVGGARHLLFTLWALRASGGLRFCPGFACPIFCVTQNWPPPCSGLRWKPKSLLAL